MSAVKIIALVVLVSLMFGAGLQLNRANFIALLKNYWLLGRALIANFIIVPLLAVLLVRLFSVNDDVATGILLMAIAPGGLGVLLSTRKKGASLDLAISLTLIFGLLSFITIPIMAPLVLPAAAAASVPTSRLIAILLFQIVPLLIGAVLADRSPAAAEKIARPVGLLTLLGAVALLVVLAPHIAKSIMTVYGSRGLETELLLVALSCITGYLLGGPLREHRRTLSLATAVRVFALALVIATQQFAGTDVAAVVMTYFVVQVLVSVIVGMYYTRTAATSEAPA